MKSNRLATFVSAFLIIILNVKCQIEIDDIKKSLTRFTNEHRQEKLYLHLPKTKFSLGESIWFKGYLIESSALRISASEVIYVDLISESGEIVESRTLKFINGLGHGDIKLTDDLTPGNYLIRAYSNWMCNFSEDFFYNQPITISGKEETEQRGEINKDSLILHFFPEGGDLIDGILNRVAFKSTNTYGQSKSVSGKIVDSEGNLISTFETKKFGLGEFLISPNAETEYFAITDSTNQRFELPEINQSGVSMSLRHAETLDFVQVNLQSKNINMEGGYIIGHANGSLIFEAGINTSTTASLNIPRSAFPPGVFHITFFNNNGEAMAERLVFPNIPKREYSSISSDKEVYSKREKVKISFALNDTSFLSGSVGVTPLIENHFSIFHRNIVNYLLLDSDLKGEIENPDFYFSGANDAYKLLDLLMRTHGWSRFDWKSLIQQEFQPRYSMEIGMTIYGRIMDYFKKDVSREASFTFMTLENDFHMASGETDENGYFSINGINFFDSTQVAINAKGYKGKKNKEDEFVSVKLLDRPTPAVDLLAFPAKSGHPEGNKNFDEKANKLIQIQQAFNLDPDAKLLSELVITASSLKSDPFERPGNIYLTPSNRVIPDSVGWASSAQSAFDMLRIIPGVQVGGSFPNQTALIRGPNSFNADLQPLYLLDGIPVDNLTISSIPVSDIGFIDVLKGGDAAIYGARGSGGVIAIYTKIGSDTVVDKESKGILLFRHPGYYESREFFCPDYSIPKEEHIIPDYRSLVYWNPNVSLVNGQGEIEFYTSDELGNYELRFEGINADLEPLFQTILISVD